MKVGKEKNFTKRVDAWGDKHYKSTEISTFFPPRGVGNMRTNEGKEENAPTPVPFCLRLESLIHIELKDLMQHRAYRDKDFPKGGPPSPRPKMPPMPCFEASCAFFSFITSNQSRLMA